MRAAKAILAAQTGAGNSLPFYVGSHQKATVMASPNLAGGETADVQVSHDDGTTWIDIQDTSALELSATRTMLQLDGPALYRLAKDSTAGATGLYLFESHSKA